MTFWPLTNSDYPTDQTFQQPMTLIPNLAFTELWVVSTEHLQRVWHASRARLPFRTPGSVPFCGACKCSDCWDQFSRPYVELMTVPNWTFIEFRGFRGSFATGVACQQGALTRPDTCFRPRLWDLLVLQLLRPDSSNLPCLYSTFHLEYPSVLSRLCLAQKAMYWGTHRYICCKSQDKQQIHRKYEGNKNARIAILADFDILLSYRGRLLLWTPGPVPL